MRRRGYVVERHIAPPIGMMAGPLVERAVLVGDFLPDEGAALLSAMKGIADKYGYSLRLCWADELGLDARLRLSADIEDVARLVSEPGARPEQSLCQLVSRGRAALAELGRMIHDQVASESRDSEASGGWANGSQRNTRFGVSVGAGKLATASGSAGTRTRSGTPVGGTDTNWETVQRRLLAKYEQNELYTSIRRLAEELGCSDATVRKAIRKSPRLEGWQARHRGPKAAPRAHGLDIVEPNLRQAREPTPCDALSDEEVEAIMARLIDQASPEVRAELNARGPDERRKLAEAARDQLLDAEPSPLAPETPGKVKAHKRA